jgi:hypothetical protein
MRCLKLALSKGPNRVGVSLPHLKTKQIQFPKLKSSRYLEFRTMDKVQKPSVLIVRSLQILQEICVDTAHTEELFTQNSR